MARVHACRTRVHNVAVTRRTGSADLPLHGGHVPSWLAARMAALGLAPGVLLSFAAAKVETAALFGVRPLDAFSFAGALAILSLAVMLAALLPARRAASIEPMQAMRTE